MTRSELRALAAEGWFRVDRFGRNDWYATDDIEELCELRGGCSL